MASREELLRRGHLRRINVAEGRRADEPHRATLGGVGREALGDFSRGFLDEIAVVTGLSDIGADQRGQNFGGGIGALENVGTMGAQGAGMLLSALLGERALTFLGGRALTALRTRRARELVRDARARGVTRAGASDAELQRLALPQATVDVGRTRRGQLTRLLTDEGAQGSLGVTLAQEAGPFALLESLKRVPDIGEGDRSPLDPQELGLDALLGGAFAGIGRTGQELISRGSQRQLRALRDAGADEAKLAEEAARLSGREDVLSRAVMAPLLGFGGGVALGVVDEEADPLTSGLGLALAATGMGRLRGSSGAFRRGAAQRSLQGIREDAIGANRTLDQVLADLPVTGDSGRSEGIPAGPTLRDSSVPAGPVLREGAAEGARARRSVADRPALPPELFGFGQRGMQGLIRRADRAVRRGGVERRVPEGALGSPDAVQRVIDLAQQNVATRNLAESDLPPALRRDQRARRLALEAEREGRRTEARERERGTAGEAAAPDRLTLEGLRPVDTRVSDLVGSRLRGDTPPESRSLGTEAIDVARSNAPEPPRGALDLTARLSAPEEARVRPSGGHRPQVDEARLRRLGVPEEEIQALVREEGRGEPGREPLTPEERLRAQLEPEEFDEASEFLRGDPEDQEVLAGERSEFDEIGVGIQENPQAGEQAAARAELMRVARARRFQELLGGAETNPKEASRLGRALGLLESLRTELGPDLAKSRTGTATLANRLAQGMRAGLGEQFLKGQEGSPDTVRGDVFARMRSAVRRGEAQAKSVQRDVRAVERMLERLGFGKGTVARQRADEIMRALDQEEVVNIDWTLPKAVQNVLTDIAEGAFRPKAFRETYGVSLADALRLTAFEPGGSPRRVAILSPEGGDPLTADAPDSPGSRVLYLEAGEIPPDVLEAALRIDASADRLGPEGDLPPSEGFVRPSVEMGGVEHADRLTVARHALAVADAQLHHRNRGDVLRRSGLDKDAVGFTRTQSQRVIIEQFLDLHAGVTEVNPDGTWKMTGEEVRKGIEELERMLVEEMDSADALTPLATREQLRELASRVSQIGAGRFRPLSDQNMRGKEASAVRQAVRHVRETLDQAEISPKERKAEKAWVRRNTVVVSEDTFDRLAAIAEDFVRRVDVGIEETRTRQAARELAAGWLVPRVIIGTRGKNKGRVFHFAPALTIDRVNRLAHRRSRSASGEEPAQRALQKELEAVGRAMLVHGDRSALIPIGGQEARLYTRLGSLLDSLRFDSLDATGPKDKMGGGRALHTREQIQAIIDSAIGPEVKVEDWMRPGYFFEEEWRPLDIDDFNPADVRDYEDFLNSSETAFGGRRAEVQDLLAAGYLPELAGYEVKGGAPRLTIEGAVDPRLIRERQQRQKTGAESSVGIEAVSILPDGTARIRYTSAQQADIRSKRDQVSEEAASKPGLVSPRETESGADPIAIRGRPGGPEHVIPDRPTRQDAQAKAQTERPPGVDDSLGAARAHELTVEYVPVVADVQRLLNWIGGHAKAGLEHDIFSRDGVLRDLRSLTLRQLKSMEPRLDQIRSLVTARTSERKMQARAIASRWERMWPDLSQKTRDLISELMTFERPEFEGVKDPKERVRMGTELLRQHLQDEIGWRPDFRPTAEQMETFIKQAGDMYDLTGQMLLDMQAAGIPVKDLRETMQIMGYLPRLTAGNDTRTTFGRWIGRIINGQAIKSQEAGLKDREVARVLPRMLDTSGVDALALRYGREFSSGRLREIRDLLDRASRAPRRERRRLEAEADRLARRKIPKEVEARMLEIETRLMENDPKMPKAERQRLVREGDRLLNRHGARPLRLPFKDNPSDTLRVSPLELNPAILLTRGVNQESRALYVADLGKHLIDQKIAMTYEDLLTREEVYNDLVSDPRHQEFISSIVQARLDARAEGRTLPGAKPPEEVAERGLRQILRSIAAKYRANPEEPNLLNAEQRLVDAIEARFDLRGLEMLRSDTKRTVHPRLEGAVDELNPLRGYLMPRQIADHLDHVTLNPVGLRAFYDGFLREWRKNKTTRNPATHIRQWVFNAMIQNPLRNGYLRTLREFGGDMMTAIHRGAGRRHPALERLEAERGRRQLSRLEEARYQRLLDADRAYDEAHRSGGVFNVDFASTEIGPILDSAIRHLGDDPFDGGLLSGGRKIARWLSTVDQFAQGAYTLSDNVSRFSNFRMRLSDGMTPELALKDTNKYTQNYANTPELLNNLSQFTPFIKFDYEAARILIHHVRDAFVGAFSRDMAMADRLENMAAVGRMAVFYALAQMWNEHQFEDYGLSGREEDAVREFMRGRFKIWLPPSDDGEPRFLDITHHLPFGGVQMYERQSTGMTNGVWGRVQDVADIPRQVTNYGWDRVVLGNPILRTAFEVAGNRSLMTNGNLWTNPGDRGARLTAFVWDQWAPSLAGSGARQMIDAALGRRDFAGTERGIGQQALATVGSFQVQELPARAARRFEAGRRLAELGQARRGVAALEASRRRGQAPPRTLLPGMEIGFDKQRESILNAVIRDE